MPDNKIEKLLKKYKYDRPLCEVCGGHVIRDREWVCDNCGLVWDKILEPTKKRDPGFMYGNTTESLIHKGIRTDKHERELDREDRKEKKLTTMPISKKYRTFIKEYQEKTGLTQWEVLDELIEKKMEEENDKLER